MENGYSVIGLRPTAVTKYSLYFRTAPKRKAYCKAILCETCEKPPDGGSEKGSGKIMKQLGQGMDNRLMPRQRAVAGEMANL